MDMNHSTSPLHPVARIGTPSRAFYPGRSFMALARPILTSRHYAWIMLAFVAFVIYGSLVPLTYKYVPIEQAFEKYANAFSQPVVVKNRADWLANILLFIPLGFVAMGWLSVDVRRPNPLAIAGVLISCALLSAGIEFTQIYFPPRDTSINDVVAETLGGAIGILSWQLSGQRFTEYVRQLWSTQGSANWAVRLLPGYIMLLIFVQGMPFDLTLSPDLLKKKYHDGKVLLIPFTGEPLEIIKKRLINAAFFLPAGMLLGGLHGWFGRGRWAGLRIFVAGVVLAGSIEFMQLLVVTRFFDTTDIITGSLAVLLGWYLMRLWQLRQPVSSTDCPAFPAGLRIALLFVWVAALVYINWVPFNFQPQDWQQRLQEINWLPFVDYYAGNYLNSFDAIVEKTVLFVPFGLLLSSATGSRLDLLRVILSALLLATMIEFGQMFLMIEDNGKLVHQHTPGVSDIIIETFGAFAGAVAARRLRVLTSEIPVAEVVPNRAYVR